MTIHFAYPTDVSPTEEWAPDVDPAWAGASLDPGFADQFAPEVRGDGSTRYQKRQERLRVWRRPIVVSDADGAALEAFYAAIEAEEFSYTDRTFGGTYYRVRLDPFDLPKAGPGIVSTTLILREQPS